MTRILLAFFLLAPLALPQAPGGYPPPPIPHGEWDGYDPADPGTWGLPMIPGYG